MKTRRMFVEVLLTHPQNRGWVVYGTPYDSYGVPWGGGGGGGGGVTVSVCRFVGRSLGFFFPALSLNISE